MAAYIALSEQARAESQKADNWQKFNVGLSVAAAGLAAPTDSALGIAASAANPLAAYHIGQYFKHNAELNKIDGGNRPDEGSKEHIALHTLNGILTGMAAGNDAVASGLASGGGEVIAPTLAKTLYGKDAKNLNADEKAYQAVIRAAQKTLVAKAQTLSQTILTILSAHREAREQMKPNWTYFADVDAQLNRLVYAGFISATPIGRLPDVARYLQGVVIRLQKAHRDPQKDARWQTQVEPFTRKLTDKIGNKRLDKSLSPEILEFAYLLEEYRLSVFAQGQVKVVGKVSEKRLEA